MLEETFKKVLRAVFGGGADISAANPLQVYDPKVFNSLVVYEGTATADGPDTSTITDTVLATKPDFNGQLVVITSGDYKGQTRDIDQATTGGSAHVAAAFGGIIVEGTTYVILSIRPTTAEVADIEAKLDHADHGLAALKTLLDAILEDTSTTLEDKIDAISGAMALEASLGTHDTDIKGRLDTTDGEVADIKAKLDHVALCITQWGGFEDELNLGTGAPAPTPLAACVLTPVLPAGATVWKAYLVFKFREIYCAGANYIATAGGVEISDDSFTSEMTGITIPTGTLDVAAGASAAGDCLIGNVDVSSKVASGTQNQFRMITTMRANADNLMVRDVQIGLQIFFTI